MKTGFLLLLVATSLSLNGQVVSESLNSMKKKYSPLFSKKSSVLAMDFLRTYDLSKPDTAHSLLITVDSRELEQESVTVGAFVVSTLAGGTASSTYNINKEAGGVSLSQTQLDSLYDCSNKAYTFVANRSARKSKHNAVASCGVDEIVLAGEYNPGATLVSGVKKYYFRIKEAVFEMKEGDFLQVTRFLKQSKELF